MGGVLGGGEVGLEEEAEFDVGDVHLAGEEEGAGLADVVLEPDGAAGVFAEVEGALVVGGLVAEGGLVADEAAGEAGCGGAEGGGGAAEEEDEEKEDLLEVEACAHGGGVTRGVFFVKEGLRAGFMIYD